MKKEELLQTNKFLRLISSVLVVIFVILCTGYIFAYSYGFRFTFDKDNLFEETGVLSIESLPSQANIIVNGKTFGRSPKTEGGLIAGIYDVKVQKDGYKDWEKALPIKTQYSTGYSAFLLLNTPKQDSQYTSSMTEKYTISADNNSIFIPYISTDPNDKSTTPLNYLFIDIYQLDKPFWDFNQNPSVVFKTLYDASVKYELLPSDNGESIFIKKMTNNATNNTLIISETYIIKTLGNTTPEKFEKLTLNSFYNSYKISWAKNNKFLILESDSEIYSYNIATKSIVLLFKKSQDSKKTVWKTDLLGNFYVLENAVLDMKDNTLTTNRQYFRIERKELDGTNPVYIIDNIFYTSDNKGIIPTVGETNLNIAEIPFTNSPFSTRFCGEIQDFEFHKELGAMISTEFGLYWYDLKANKFTLVQASKTELLTFSPSLNNFRFLYIDKEKDNLNVYTYFVDPSDHQNIISYKTILNNVSKTVGEARWFNSTNYISYLLGNSVYLVDVDGENRNELIKLENQTDYLFNDQNNSVYTFKTEDKIKAITSADLTTDSTTADSTKDSLNSTNLTITKWLIH